MSDTRTAPTAEGAAVRGPIRRVEAVVNAASGSVGPGAAEALAEILARHGLEANVADCQPREIEDALKRAVAAKPDLVIVLAGDGTARLAGSLCGPEGPMVAPLAGGTMNMLPHAIYGARPWREALEEVLAAGGERMISGGEIDGRPFYVAAILGAPALWAPAREAIRKGRLRLAWLRAYKAFSRAFRGRLRFAIDGGPIEKAEALTVICPLVSRGLQSDDALEACVLNPRGAADAFRLGARTLLADLLGDWREDPAVRVATCRKAYVRAHGRIPVLLDGEPHRLGETATITFRPQAFRAFAPLPPTTTAEGEHEARKAQAASALAASAGVAAS